MGFPIISMFALDVLVERDFSYANNFLLALSNHFGPEGSYSSYLLVSAVVGVAIMVLASVFQFARNRLSAVASEGIARTWREVLFDRLHRAQASFYDKEEVGDLVQRCTSDIETIRLFLHNDIDALGRVLLFLAAMIPVLLWRDAQLAGLSLILLPVILGGGFGFFAFAAKLFRETDEAEGRLTAVLQENLTGIRVVQAFAREQFEFERFDISNKDFRDRHKRLNLFESIYWGISDFVCLMQTAIVLLASGAMVMRGELTIGELFMFTSLTSVVIWRIRQLVDIVEHTAKTRVALRRIGHILTSNQELSQSVPSNAVLSGRIVFEDVTLSYGDRGQELQQINLTIDPGETIGIVGRPGSGKSTLIRALQRFYPISSGRILLDGIDISTIDVNWLRKNIGCVLQEPFLFSRSVRDNLQFGNLAASDREISQATRLAAIHGAIHEFSDGFDTKIGERGVNLSGGQRQRMALARALLANTPILILDDVLSGVDTRTETTILNGLAELNKDATTIIVAHRLTTIRNADRIVVMDAGKIVQVGTYEQLLEQPGHFRDLCDIQDLLDETIKYETELAARG